MSIMVVTDDEQQVLDLVTVILREYNVKAFSSPSAALRFLSDAEKAPLLLITDMVMPHMDGVSMAREFRSKFPKIPILLISGYIPGGSEKWPKDWRFLAKPFSPAQLKAAVAALIGNEGL